MFQFQRGLFNLKFEEKYLLLWFNRIEDLYRSLVRFPHSGEARFFAEDLVKQWIKEREHGKIISEIFNRKKFLFYTNVFKTIKLIEALFLMYNNKNYLGWTLVGRSVIEHSAIFGYFFRKLKDLDLIRTSFRMSELEQIENMLIHYSHGTRFNWNDLISGNLVNLTKNYGPSQESRKAINVITAIEDMSKKQEIFKGMDIIYSMFSDFCHPNMGSHSAFINLSGDATITGVNKLALDVNRDRAEFIMVITLEPITLHLGNIASSIIKLSEIIEFWLDNVLTGETETKFDS